MALSLFGFTLVKDKKPEDLKNQSIIEPVSYDGPTTVTAGGYYGTYVDIDASARSESELITRYREIANYPDCDNAIEEIVAEAIAVVDNEVPVKIQLDGIDFSDQIKDAITKEFEEVKKLLDFNDKAHDIFRRWYVDGRVYYQKLIDMKDPSKGIQELRYIDPRKIRKVRQLKKEKTKEGLELITKAEEFFIYNDKGLNYLSPGVSPAGSNSSGVRIATDTIAFCPSGLMDLNRNLVIGYMHKAIKPVNQLKMMADSLVIYRLARAPERRIFYIDVGNLPKLKAEQYMKDIMARYRNKVVYDSNTGEIKDDRKFMTMLEDFWLPRREGGRGTEITTLPGGQNLGEIADIDYFQNKVYQSLNIPTSRFQQSSGFNFGRSAEISHEEMKFSKFISRLRKKFDHLFNDILRTQLILKNIVTDSDWEQIKEKVYYRYASDQYFEEQKNAENLRNKLEVLTQLQPFVGTFFSKDYVRKNVLNLEQEDIDKIEAENQQEPVEQPPEEQ
mgnify:CR=1 FL=1|tara:strand:- start:11063 stop:12568 length:1506 start_codon:yes stop_codon:yes gene_type:complete